ncbi:MAG TPA: sulfotransferase [Rhizomicrobium sp.]|jgi:hypothetical protein|nr:sulfotransferase [Rhizomicrobium sp.]
MELEQKRFVLGIGAQKAGTSWVRNYLCSRHDVYFTPAEMHFFDSKYGPTKTRRANRLLLKRSAGKPPQSELLKLKLDYIQQENGAASYKEFFRARVPENTGVFGEITPSYALIGEAGYRAAREIFPNIRVFFIMRDPAERFYSQIRMSRDRHQKNATRVLQSKLLLRAKNDHRSLYDSTIRDLERAVPQENVLYLFYEKLFQHETMERFCNFLGVPYVPADFEQVVNAGGQRDHISDDLDKAIRACFETTYAFCREKFGDQLPKEWRWP